MKTAGEIGERALIELMLRHMTPMPAMPVPFWDDVVAISLGGGRVAVLKADMLVWETDVPKGMTPFQAARKAVVMNFSDLGAKGVRPQAFLASIGIPRGLAVEAVEEMARGFEAGAREYGGYVVGGDTNEAGDIIISGMAFGVAEEGKLIRRGGSRSGDVLASTGLFGETAAAFKILLDGFDAPEGIRGPLLDSVYMPRARVLEGISLAESGSVTSSIDSSDGLAMSLYDLQRSSGVGFRLESLRASPRARAFADLHGLDPADLALYGGEEYEIVFTIRQGKVEAARDALKAVGCGLVELGRATADRRILLVEDGAEKPVARGGYEHFKATDNSHT